ncbi:MAG: type II toxin-antitoxin system HicB family antitoxin [Nitrososphaera sp.]
MRIKKSSRKFTILVQKEPEGGFTGRCLELRGAVSYGRDMKELKANMKDAIALILDVLEEEAKKGADYYRKETIEIPS